MGAAEEASARAGGPGDRTLASTVSSTLDLLRFALIRQVGSRRVARSAASCARWASGMSAEIQERRRDRV